MREHSAVLLDEASYTLGDLDLSALFAQVENWEHYPSTSEEECYERLQNASIAIITK